MNTSSKTPASAFGTPRHQINTPSFTVISVTDYGQQLYASGLRDENAVHTHISDRLRSGKYAHFLVLRTAPYGISGKGPTTSIKVYDSKHTHMHPDDLTDVAFGRNLA